MLAWVAGLLAKVRGAVAYSRKAPLLLPAARLGCPVALELHSPIGPHERRGRSALGKLLEGHQLRKIICISQALADQVANEWPAAKPLLTVAHDGADLARSPSKRTEGTRPLIGYAGHLYPGKGMEIIASLARARPDWDFLVLGGRAEDIAQWRDRTAPGENIIFAGLVPHGEVADRLAAADVVLAPYGKKVIVSDLKTDVSKWMSPLKLFEYMALGKPIVASDLPVIREILKDGVNARLAAPGNCGDWEGAISELLDNREMATALGEAARRDIEKKYSWKQRARAISSAVSDVR
jgi:glycosyltransferase involved in cell wall biosynthesis